MTASGTSNNLSQRRTKRFIGSSRMGRLLTRDLARRCAPVFMAVMLILGCESTLEPSTHQRDLAAQFPGGETTNTLLLGVNSYNQRASNITDEHDGHFFTGNSLFNSPWVQAPASTEARDGLGPLFNSRSCSGCHFKDGRGRLPDGPQGHFESALIRISIGYDKDEKPVDDPVYGGQLQPLALSGVPAEGVPHVNYTNRTINYASGESVELSAPSYSITDLNYGPLADDAVLSARVAPQMIGQGLLEAIPAERLQELADPDDANQDGVSGRIRLVDSLINGTPAMGRFGWKCDQPSVEAQVSAAFLGDLGISSELFAEQNCSEKQAECRDSISGGAPEIEKELLRSVVLYSQLLAVPARRDFNNPEVPRGEDIFTQLGCGDCHVPSHQTGEVANLPEVSHQKIWPFTDLLLHNMGDDLADSDRHELDAEWRTPPLWGIGLIHSVNGHQRLLHDGRANGVEEAIVWHGGEGQISRDAFLELKAEERDALVRFVNSL